MANNPKYPNITVQLSETDGNAFSVLGRMMKELKRNGVPAADCVKFRNEATSGDYDHLLETCCRWVEVT